MQRAALQHALPGPESKMTVPGLVLPSLCHLWSQAVVMRDSDFKAVSASAGVLEHGLMCLQCSSAILNGTVCHKNGLDSCVETRSWAARHVCGRSWCDSESRSSGARFSGQTIANFSRTWSWTARQHCGRSWCEPGCALCRGELCSGMISRYSCPLSL